MVPCFNKYIVGLARAAVFTATKSLFNSKAFSLRPFYSELVKFMSSGPIIAAILEKENAVADFRILIGATDPAKAEEGTIRKLFASSVGENAIHGSDSDANAAIEGNFFFSILERF